MKQRPWGTALVSLAALAIAAAMALRHTPQTWAGYARWGYLPPARIQAGAWWGLVTAVFVHAGVLHAVLNVALFWVFSRPVERILGRFGWAVFFTGAAVASCGSQFVFSGTTGVGLSGVVYAFFGLTAASRGRIPGLGRTMMVFFAIILLGWLIACLVLTATGRWSVGNAAHVGGLAFGVGCALLLFRGRKAE